MTVAALGAARRRSYAVRKDKAQPAIIEALRSAGATVQPLNDTSKSVPDLLVGYNGLNYLLECKTLDRKGGRENAIGTLAAQAEWHRVWRGQVCVVGTPTQALQAIGVLRHD